MGRAPEGGPSPGPPLETGERIRVAVVAPVDVAAVVADPAERTDRVGLGAAGGADGGGGGHQEGEQAQGDFAHVVLPPKHDPSSNPKGPSLLTEPKAKASIPG